MSRDWRARRAAAGLLSCSRHEYLVGNVAPPKRGGCRAKVVPSGALNGILGMPQNFIDCDREQAFLMPPSLRDWLPDDHLAWFVIETVEQLDLAAFYASYRPDGHGRAAYEPSMMVSLLMFAYSTNERSSRGIERHCRQDIAYRVITANRVPDHATVARFIRRHEQPLAALFSSVLKLCAKAGLVASGVVAIDGTKLSASAASDSNVDYDRIAREIIAEAIATDEAEDDEHGDARGDELPAELQSEAGRREWLLRELEREPTSDDQPTGEESGPRSSRRASRWPGLTLSGSSPGPKAGWGGCAKRAASRTGSGGRPPDLCRARGRSVCVSPRCGWRTISPPRSAETRPMRRFESIGACMTRDGWAGPRSRTRRRRSRRAR